MSRPLSAKARQVLTDTLIAVRNVWTIMSKEIASFFATSIGYTVILGYVLTTSLFFLVILQILRDQGSIPPMYRPLSLFYGHPLILFIFMFLTAILSMRLFAQEKETGTIEMLLTVPVTDGEVVVGKYLATVVFYLMCISPSLVNTLVLFRPEVALGFFRNIVLPTLVFLPLLLIGFTFVTRRQRIGVVISLMAAALVIVVGLRVAGLDRITQKVAFIPADQVDFDNDGLADEWELDHGLDPKTADDFADPDGDGDTNLQEFTYGTDPSDPEDTIQRLIYVQVQPKNVRGKADTDRDEDGIPDQYEPYLGLSSENRDDALEDNDGDGDPNLIEWEYGTDMRDAASTLKSVYSTALPVVNSIRSIYVDRDNDGMPDTWEESFRLAANEDNRGVDTDNDGYANSEEYAYRTNPIDALSVPRLPESMAVYLHVLSYLLAVSLFLFIGYGYDPKQEARTAQVLKYIGLAGLGLSIVIAAVFITVSLRSAAAYAAFLFWGFTTAFITATALLSRLALLSRSRLNAAAAAMFLFLVFRAFWCFYIAPAASSPPDVGTTFSGYFGGFLIGAFFIAVGMFFSSLFKNQINAAVVTFAFLIVIFISLVVPQIVPELEDFKGFFDHYNFRTFLANCTEGSIPSGSLGFFISAIVLFLFLTTKVLGMRKWR